MPYEKGPILGRAFLQAAFIGTNWNAQAGWLAQAPGLGDAKTEIFDTATTIEGFKGHDLFTKSWETRLKRIDPSPPPSGLSTGAKLGIGIGAATLLGTVALVALLFWWRKRSEKKTSI